MTLSYTEIIAVILGIISVYCVVQRSVWAFPVGIVMVILYIWIFYEAKLYSDMLLQVFFVVMQALGWKQWLQGKKDADEKIAIKSLSRSQIGITIGIIAVGTLALGTAMHQFTDASIPYADALTTMLSVMGQWWLNARYLENWTLWIIADVLYIGLYGYKELYLTAGLYIVFLVLAVMGYREWKQKVILEP